MSNFNPKPKASDRCVVCGEPVTAPPFVASKPRRGGATIYAHTPCLQQEQKVRLLNHSLAAYEVLAQQGGGEA